MNEIKKIYLVLIIVGVSFPYTIAQQQNNIPWPSLADSPWPVLRGDMQGTGRSRFIGPRTNNVLWRKDMPLGVLYGPVIGYNDILYMGERAISPENVNYFYAVDKNGNDLWTFETETSSPNNSGPVLLHDSTIYFFSRNQKMYALNQGGSLKWEQNIWANFRPFYPIAKNGDIYVAQIDELLVVSTEGNIKDTLSIPDISPAIAFSTEGDTIYLTTGGSSSGEMPGALNAVNLEGNIYWKYNFSRINWGIPLVDNQNKIYVFGRDSISQVNNYLYCIKPDGTLDWRYGVHSFEGRSSPTIDKDGNIIIIARKIINSVERNCIISLDYYGNENWVTPFEGDWDDHYINHGLVSDAEGKIYCGSSTGGNFYCFDNNGELLWTFDLGDLEYDSNPAIGSDGTLYIGTHISSLFQNHTQNLIAIRDTGSTGVNDNMKVIDYKLMQNYPNPFNPSTTIKYQLSSSGIVTLKVYDILGNQVAKLVDKYQNAGEYDVIFSADELVSGIYFYRLRAGNYTDVKKMIFLK
jgi:outer membrane protein assembly factor BamB